VSVARAAFDFYMPGRSRLHRLDPRVKLVLVVAGSAVTLLWVNIWLLTGVVVVVHAGLLLSAYPGGRLLAIWRTIAPLLIVVVIVWPLFDRGGATLVSLGPLDITGLALLRGTVTAARLAAVSFIFLLWIGTTGVRELVRGFVRLGLPVAWGMSLTIGLRFIPTFAGIFQTVTDAQKSRGLVIEGHVIRRAKLMLPILVSSLVTALRASEQLAMTLEARAFGVTPHRTVLRDIHMTRADWLALALIVFATSALVYATLVYDLGRELTGLP
jgi:energy-coupling factor transport system permease protein